MTREVIDIVTDMSVLKDKGEVARYIAQYEAEHPEADRALATAAYVMGRTGMAGASGYAAGLNLSVLADSVPLIGDAVRGKRNYGSAETGVMAVDPYMKDLLVKDYRALTKTQKGMRNNFLAGLLTGKIPERFSGVLKGLSKNPLVAKTQIRLWKADGGIRNLLNAGSAPELITPEGVRMPAEVTGTDDGLVYEKNGENNGNTGGGVNSEGSGIIGESSSNPKFSEMSAEDIARVAEEFKGRSPIEIPENAVCRGQSKNGYEQLSYKWKDGAYKYESRWHTRTPGAPEDQGNTWVVTRTRPGKGGLKPVTEFFVDNEWVPAFKWYDAIGARKAGIATKEQLDLLDRGHWKE